MNDKLSKVTIRMSAYNHEKYIEQAIRSIYGQTYQNFELLVIDDGSSDRTPEILEKLSQEYGFYFERQQNMGLPKTLNKLIRMAEGEYVSGCASDDYWPPNRLEEQVAELDSDPDVDLVHSNVTAINEDGCLLPVTESTKPFVDGEDQFIPFIMHQTRYYAPTHMVRRASFHRVGYFNETIGVEDFEWWMRATRVLNIKYVDTSWLFYRQHPSNWIKRPDGALKSANSHYAVAKELGLFYGFIFLLTIVSSLMLWESISGRARRFLYLLLLPLLFWNLRYLKSLVIVLLGYRRVSLWRQWLSARRRITD